VARLAGGSVATLRYDEQAGLIAPAERQAGRRVYTAGVLHALQVTTVLRKAGLGVREVRRVLASKVVGRSVLGHLLELQAALDNCSNGSGSVRRP
jgi:DNA-binding transcriptional MerR regulator